MGQVVETGADAYFNKGDRVYLADCVENDETESGIDIAGETRDGYYRDFAYVSAQEAYVLPPSVSDDAAFLIDAVATAEKIADETGADVGQHVLVVGGGLYANVLCQILIWHRVVPVLADNNPERLALAKKCGIYYTFPYDDTLKENLLRITGGMLADAAVYFAFSNKSEPSRVFSLTRRGAVRSEMTFAAGECHTIFYELPLGRLTMELHTDSACASFDGACGTLELCYRLTVRDETVSENRLTVTLAPR